MDDYSTEADLQRRYITEFKAVVVGTRQNNEETIKRKTTRSGKPLGGAARSNLYGTISVPSLHYLKFFDSEKFTDESGRLYWDAESVPFGWERLTDILEASWFDKGVCSIFYVRPKRGNPLTLPEHNERVRLYPMGSISDSADYECVWCGNDEESTNPEKRNQRKSAFVVYRKL